MAFSGESVGSIHGVLDLDRSPFTRGLKEARDQVRKFEEERHHTNVGVALTGLNKVKAQLDSLHDKTVHVRVEQSGGGGVGSNGITGLQAGIAGGAVFGPQVLAMLGQATLGAGALGVALGGAAAAFGVLGAAASSQLGQAADQSKKMTAKIVADNKRVQTAQTAVTTAYATGTAKTQASANLRLALAQQQLAKDKQLQASQGNLAAQVVKGAQDMKKAFVTALGPGTQQLFQGLLSGMGTVKQALPDLSGPFLTLGTAIKNALQSPAIQTGIKSLIDGFGKIVTATAPLVGPVLQGFINVGKILEHIAVAAMPGLVKLTQSFVGWLGKIANSTGTPKFAAEVQKWIDKFQTLVKDIGGVIKALAPLFASASGFQPLIVAATNIVGWFAKLLTKLGPIGRLLTGGLGLAFIAGKFSSLGGPLGAVVTGVTKLVPLFSKLGGLAIAGMLSAFPKLIPLFWGLDAAVTGFVPAMAAAALAVAPFILAVLAIGALVAAVILFHKQIFAAIKAAWGAIKDAVSAIVGAIVSVVTGAWNFIKKNIKTIMEAILVIVTGGFAAIPLLVVKYHKQIIKALEDAWKFIEKIFTKAWDAIKTGVSKGVKAVVGVIGKLPGEALRALGNIGKALWDAGVHLIEGFIKGALSVIGDVVNLGKKIVDSIGNAVTGLLGISSPSKVAHKWGQAVGQGLVMGLTSQLGAVKSASGQLAAAAAGGKYGAGFDYANTSWFKNATAATKAIIGQSESQIRQGQAAADRSLTLAHQRDSAAQAPTIVVHSHSLVPASPTELHRISATVSEAHRRSTPSRGPRRRHR
jgi:phage-related protein